MASLIPNLETRERVNRRIEFSFNGTRIRFKLGKLNARDGQDILLRFETLVEDVQFGRPHSHPITEWLKGLPIKMREKLIKVGLMKSAGKADVLLGDFLDGMKGTAVKASTKATYNNAMNNLLEHFGRQRTLSSITHADAIEFKEKCLQSPTAAYGKRPLAKATIGRRVIMSRQFFTAALRKDLITKNPFVGVKGGNQRNPERLELVEADMVDRLIAATGDQDWKLLLLLARYGGIRIPSEVIKLKWQHVDFRQNRILIHSPKTEHHEGKERRYIPMFDELRQPLLDAHAKGVDLYAFVIENATYRTGGANLRTQLDRIADNAGIRLWAKPWQNMRATRETELIERIGLKEACAIIGNSEIVALQHYQMLRPQFMESAIERDRKARQGAQKGAQPNQETRRNEGTPPDNE